MRPIDRKRGRGVFREEGEGARLGGRKQAMGTRRSLEAPLVANQRLSLGFASDWLTEGRPSRILTVVGDCPPRP